MGGPWAQRALRAPPAVVLVGVGLRWPERADRGGTYLWLSVAICGYLSLTVFIRRYLWLYVAICG